MDYLFIKHLFLDENHQVNIEPFVETIEEETKLVKVKECPVLECPKVVCPALECPRVVCPKAIHFEINLGDKNLFIVIGVLSLVIIFLLYFIRKMT